jgi:hypothetical protein
VGEKMRTKSYQRFDGKEFVADKTTDSSECITSNGPIKSWAVKEPEENYNKIWDLRGHRIKQSETEKQANGPSLGVAIQQENELIEKEETIYQLRQKLATAEKEIEAAFEKGVMEGRSTQAILELQARQKFLDELKRKKKD